MEVLVNLRNDCAPPKNPNFQFSSVFIGLFELFKHLDLSRLEKNQSSMYPGVKSFVRISNQPIFIFYWLSKVFMTVFHQNLTNDRVPPNFEKWLCSTKKSQYSIFINFLRPLWTFQAPGPIKVGEKSKFHVPGRKKFCQNCQSTNFYFLSAI